MIFIFLFFFINSYAIDQNNSLFIQGTTIENNSSKISNYYTNKNPLKAGLYSAIFPGLGQWYNSKKIKAPIALGLVGTSLAITCYLRNRYQNLKLSYINTLNGECHQYSTITTNLTAEICGTIQDNAKKHRDYSILITSLLYMLNIIDAIVDTHLSDFNVEKDLSFHLVISEEFNSYLPINQLIKFKFNF